MTYKYCPSCKGRKKLIGMGFTELDCATCRATGYVEVNDPKPANPPLSAAGAKKVAPFKAFSKPAKAAKVANDKATNQTA